MSDDLSKVVLARLNRLEMFAGHVADWAGNALLHIKARAMLEATAQEVAQPKGLTTNETLPSDDIAKRMEAAIRELAKRDNGDGTVSLVDIRKTVADAVEIVSLLPEPVDEDALEAERIAYEMDGGLPRDLVLAGLKAGRALERDSREG